MAFRVHTQARYTRSRPQQRHQNAIALLSSNPFVSACRMVVLTAYFCFGSCFRRGCFEGCLFAWTACNRFKICENTHTSMFKFTCTTLKLNATTTHQMSSFSKYREYFLTDGRWSFQRLLYPGSSY